jgi:cytoskeletal protein CcmA (bactofilin family)
MWNPAPSSSPTDLPKPEAPKSPANTQQVEERRVVAWIGQSVTFKGELVSSEDMRIEGKIEGTIELRNHDLTVGPNAQIRADIVAKTITVRGTVTGKLTASERIEIRETASIQGEITAPRLAVTDGANIQGRIQTKPSQAGKAEPKLAAVK